MILYIAKFDYNYWFNDSYAVAVGLGVGAPFGLVASRNMNCEPLCQLTRSRLIRFELKWTLSRA